MAPSQVPNLSETARGGCCKVCAEPEEEDKRFLICGHSLCMYKYYHIRCLNPDQIASERQVGQRRWYCPSCLCRSCHKDVDDGKIILCDRCDEAYHLYCLKPRRTKVPKGDWYCKFCTGASAREEKMRRYENSMLQLHRKRDRAMVKSDRFAGMELLIAAVEEELVEEAAIAAEELKRKEKVAPTVAE